MIPQVRVVYDEEAFAKIQKQRHTLLEISRKHLEKQPDQLAHSSPAPIIVPQNPKDDWIPQGSETELVSWVYPGPLTVECIPFGDWRREIFNEKVPYAPKSRQEL